MQRYQDSIILSTGQAVVGASVQVLTYPAGAVATIYSDNGSTTTTNPLITDGNGHFAFYAADARYSLVITKVGIAPITVSDILLEDPADGSAALSASGGAALVGFLPSGIGAVSRPVQTALRAMTRLGDYDTQANFNTASAALMETCGFNAVVVASSAVLPNAGTSSIGYRMAATLQAGSNGSYQISYYASPVFATQAFTGLEGFGLLVDCGTWTKTGTGTLNRLYGIYIDEPFPAGLAATNSAALSIGVNPAGDWAIYSSSTKASKLIGALTVAGLTISTSGATISGNVAITGSLFASTLIQAADGLANAPSITFNNQATVGIYRAGGNALGIATNGVVAVTVNSAQAMTVVGAFGCNGATAQTASTGYGTPTNVAKQASFDATTITLPNLAKAVGQLIIDLKANGFLAA